MKHLSRTHRSAELTAAVLAAIVATLFFVPGAVSASPQAPDDSTVDARRPSSVPTGLQTDLDAHWTAERMAASRPADVDEATVGTDTGTELDLGPARSVEPTAPEAEPGAKQPAFSYATGRLFYDDQSGEPWNCSASSIASTNQSLVLTAGHCLHDGGGTEAGWSVNVVYVPGYDEGDEPRERWNGIFSSQLVFDTWYSGGDRTRDVGMFLVEPNAIGQRLTQMTGGHGFATGQGYDLDLHVIGYPSNLDNGEVQQHCWGPVSEGDDRVELECGFGKGASGGPWLKDYSAPGPGLGKANGVTSSLTNDGKWNRSPYFDDAVWNIYMEMESL